jgi:hypothetical protein
LDKEHYVALSVKLIFGMSRGAKMSLAFIEPKYVALHQIKPPPPSMHQTWKEMIIYAKNTKGKS